jgi:down-regulator of transcription 1
MSDTEDEPAIPRAALNKLIKDVLPNLRVSAETRDLISACCTEFIHLVASEANDICEKQQRKTITPEHVVEALESLGFGEVKHEDLSNASAA